MALHVRAVLLPEAEQRDLWLVDDRITFEPVAGATTIVDGGFVLPGLVDAHCHIGIQAGGAPVLSVDQARENAIRDRDAAVLAIRDAGSPIAYPSLRDDEQLPRLIRAGRHIAPVRRYLRDIGVEVSSDELSAAVVEQARAGDGWVKLVGDWIDRQHGDLAPAWAGEQMAAAIAAAHGVGARVAAHLFAEESAAMLIRAGVDSVEHGTGLCADDLAEMARRGTALVPTMINVATFGGIAAAAQERFPAYAKHMLALRDGFATVVRSAFEAGVPIYVGTDAGGGIEHGQVVQEMLALHGAGMPAEAVLRSASWGAREWLGLPGLVEGGLADLVAYDDDPRRELAVVGRPRRIVLKGRVIC